MTLTIALAGSRRSLDPDRRDLVWTAFLDAMYALRDRLAEPPPFRFLAADLSSFDRYLVERLTGAGREVVPVTAAGGDRSVAAVLHQLRLDLEHVDALAGVWDARVHEPLDLLRAASHYQLPYEIRILHAPATPLGQGQPPWHVVSTNSPSGSRVPVPNRTPTIGERFGTAYDLPLG